MLIAIDYDLTFTKDPSFWTFMINVGRERGHEFICVTGREQPPRPDEPIIPCKVICAPDAFKAQVARKAGYNVDVWIDDCPGMIEECRILNFD